MFLRKLKYARHLGALPNCPPACSERRQVLFRFVRADIHDPRNFQPPALLNPVRQFKADEARCSSFALSFFESAGAAVTRYRSMQSRHPSINETLGTHLAQVEIMTDDGLLTLPRSNHVDLHEYEGTHLAPRAKIVDELHSGGSHGS